jgi:hypothetical protein
MARFGVNFLTLPALLREYHSVHARFATVAGAGSQALIDLRLAVQHYLSKLQFPDPNPRCSGGPAQE